MVQSVLKNLKNQTRRTKGLEFFNDAPEKYRYDGNDQPDLLEPLDKNYHWFEFVGSDGKPMEAYKAVKCPYGQIGDILWVREKFEYFEATYDTHGGVYEKTSSVKIQFVSDGKISDLIFVDKIKAIKALEKIENGKIGKTILNPSIYMPKDAARIFLKITDVRIERLQDISEIDAKNEGIETKPYGSHPFFCTIDYLSKKNPKTGFRPGYCADTGKQYRSSFTSLWRKINGYQSWSDNPWVWVIEFKRVEKPQNFI
jgi:hypothetical protein